MNKLVLIVPVLLLAACSSTSPSGSELETSETKTTTTIGKVLNLDKNNDFDKIIYKSFIILGTDCYVADTFESSDKDYVNALFDYLLGQEVSSTKEQDTTRYGGDMTEYRFGNETYIRFWSGLLFVSGNDSPYSGEFYKVVNWKGVPPTTTNKESYISLFTDAKSAKVEETEKTNGVLEGLLNLKFSLYSNEPLKLPVLYTVSVGSEKIYVHEDGIFNFQVSPNTYKLNEGYSFSFLA